MEQFIALLETFEKRKIWIEKMLSTPAFLANRSEVLKLEKELSQIQETAELYTQYKLLKAQIKNDTLLLSDPELAELATEEIKKNEERALEIEEEIKENLLPKDVEDTKNVVVEIRGAVGGDEGNIFAGDLFRMYSRFCNKNNYKIEILDASEAEIGGYSLISFLVKGKNAYAKLKFESGAHRVQRVPKTEANGRIHTSTATVIVMPEAEEIDVNIKPEDLQIDVYRASGAGGQHINKTESAVRITHAPTGIVVTCQDGRSQHENKATAMMLMRTKLYEHQRLQAELSRGSERKAMIGTGDRSEKIRTYNYPQNRITDHRINFSLQQLDKVMEGNLDEIITQLVNSYKQQQLENGRKDVD